MIGIVSRDRDDVLMAERIGSWFAIPIVFSLSTAPLQRLDLYRIFVIPIHTLEQKEQIEAWLVDRIGYELA